LLAGTARVRGSKGFSGVEKTVGQDNGSNRVYIVKMSVKHSFKVRFVGTQDAGVQTPSHRFQMI